MILKSMRNLNNPNVPLTSSNILEYLGIGEPNKSGQSVTVSSALGLGPVWQCVNMISGDIAKLPLEIHKRTGPKSREKDKNHPAYLALARMANPGCTSYRLWRRMMVHLLLWQRAFIWIKRPTAGRIELYNLLPDRTWFDSGAATADSPTGMFFTEVTGKAYPVPLFPSEVIDFEGVALDDSNGCRLASKAKHAWGIALARQEFKARFYNHGAHSGGYLEIPNTMTPLAADTLEEGFRKRHSSSDNWFKTVILRDGAKFHATTTDPDKQQLSQATKDDAIEICRWFNIQPSRIGVQGSESYGSKEQDNEGYFDQTLSSHACSIRTECWHKLLSPTEQRTDSHIIEHNVRSLFQMNAKTQADVGSIEMQMGAISANDYLAATNRNPIPGGDIRVLPKNMYLISADGEIMNPDFGETAPPEPDFIAGTPPNSQASATARSVFDAAIVHAFRKITTSIKKEIHRKDSSRFCKWWDTKRNGFASDMLTAIDAAGRVFCHVSRSDVTECLGAVQRDTIDLLVSRIESALETSQPDELAENVRAICDDDSILELCEVTI